MKNEKLILALWLIVALSIIGLVGYAIFHTKNLWALLALAFIPYPKGSNSGEEQNE